jgi:hypothetical protein
VRARRTDTEHAAVIDALERSGYPCRSLHVVGGGCEDILVAATAMFLDLRVKLWLPLEVKTVHNKRAEPTLSQFTTAQLRWYETTRGWPRIIAMGPQDAVTKIRRMTG